MPINFSKQLYFILCFIKTTQLKKEKIMELVEIATFTFPNDTDVLESLFQSEGIEYFLKDQNSSMLFPGVGTSVAVRGSDVKRAVELIKQAGFEANVNHPFGTI
jgi:hypothetical protein